MGAVSGQLSELSSSIGLSPDWATGGEGISMALRSSVQGHVNVLSPHAPTSAHARAQKIATHNLRCNARVLAVKNDEIKVRDGMGEQTNGLQRMDALAHHSRPR